jgi:hypothetical protein
MDDHASQPMGFVLSFHVVHPSLQACTPSVRTVPSVVNSLQSGNLVEIDLKAN